MTEVTAKRLRTPGPLPVVTVSLAAFLVVLALLAWQMGRGRDPSLGAQAAATPPARRAIVHRKIVRRVVVDHVVPAPVVDQPAPAAPVASAPASTPAPRSYTPAPAAPAPAPTPAPAPPVTTRTS